jgi:hypothetical protein
MTAIITLFLEALPSLLVAGEDLYTYIVGMKTALSQSTEWTAENDAAWQAALIADGKSPEWLG